MRVGRGFDECEPRIESLKHKGILQLITVKTYETGAHNPLGLLKMRGN